MPAKKRSAGKPKRKKARAQKAKRSGRQNTVAELVRLQQKAVGRMADVWANAADRAAKGNFSVTQWLTDYSELWGGLTDDYAKALKTMFPTKR
jgi:hypothetical protein